MNFAGALSLQEQLERLELSTVRWQRTILPLNYSCKERLAGLEPALLDWKSRALQTWR